MIWHAYFETITQHKKKQKGKKTEDAKYHCIRKKGWLKYNQCMSHSCSLAV